MAPGPRFPSVSATSAEKLVVRFSENRGSDKGELFLEEKG